MRRILYFTICIFFLLNGNSQADSFGNLWSDSNKDSNIIFEWMDDIEETGTLYNFPHNDQAGDQIDIGFNFPFLSGNYSQCIINANGWIGFGSDSDAWENISIPSSSAPGPAIFGFWDDLNPVNDQCNSDCSGYVYYYGNGEKFIVSFNEFSPVPIRYLSLYLFFDKSFKRLIFSETDKSCACPVLPKIATP